MLEYTSMADRFSNCWHQSRMEWVASRAGGSWAVYYMYYMYYKYNMYNICNTLKCGWQLAMSYL